MRVLLCSRNSNKLRELSALLPWELEPLDADGYPEEGDTSYYENARAKAAYGHEAVCVSHQLPIWVTRRMAESKRLWHNPASRECALGSVTSFTYSGDRLTGVYYTVPARGQVTQGDAAQ